MREFFKHPQVRLNSQHNIKPKKKAIEIAISQGKKTVPESSHPCSPHGDSSPGAKGGVLAKLPGASNPTVTRSPHLVAHPNTEQL
jgi:hypothetical protein